MIPLLQTKTADTAHTGIFAGPFPEFWVGPGDEARWYICPYKQFNPEDPGSTPGLMSTSILSFSIVQDLNPETLNYSRFEIFSSLVPRLPLYWT